MGILNKDIDIAGNIKHIELYKSQLLTEVAILFSHLTYGGQSGAKDELADDLSNIIMLAYLLGRRTGISYNLVDGKLIQKIRLAIMEKSGPENENGDMTGLLKHLQR